MLKTLNHLSFCYRGRGGRLYWSNHMIYSQSLQLLNDGQMSEWWFTFKLMMVNCSLMMGKRVYDHTLISPSLTSISPSLTSILASLAWSKPSFAHLTIIEKLRRLIQSFLPWSNKGRRRKIKTEICAKQMGPIFPEKSGLHTSKKRS